MALLEGKTPNQVAKEIIESATKEYTVTVEGTVEQKLETVVRYLNRDKIQGYSESWYKSNRDNLMKATVEELISAREKAIINYLKEKEKRDKDDAFRRLISMGITIPEAYTKVFGSTGMATVPESK